MTEQTFRFQVDGIIPECPNVKTFRLLPQGLQMPFRFSPGQHLGVRPVPKGAPASADEKWRHFSLSGSPLEDSLAITVLRQGTVSERMHSMAPGDWVETTRPAGSFTLPDSVGHGPVFFAGGIGIAPIRSMIRFCLQKGLGDAISLFASFSSPEQAIYKDDLRAWASRTPKISIWLTYTEGGSRPKDQASHSHEWDRAFLQERIEKPLERVYLLCAPRGLMDAIETRLASMGVSEDRVYRERW